MNFILSYWVEFGFGLVIAVITFFGKMIMKELSDIKIAWNASQDAIQGLLYIRIKIEADKIIHNGYITASELSSLEILYKSYTDLGGNGVIKKLYTECKKLPIKLEKEL